MTVSAREAVWRNGPRCTRTSDSRAEKAQRTAREAGDVYEMQAVGLRGVAYDDCLPIVRDRLKDRIKWVWSEEIDDAYEGEKAKMMRFDR